MMTSPALAIIFAATLVLSEVVEEAGGAGVGGLWRELRVSITRAEDGGTCEVHLLTLRRWSAVEVLLVLLALLRLFSMPSTLLTEARRMASTMPPPVEETELERPGSWSSLPFWKRPRLSDQGDPVGLDISI